MGPDTQVLDGLAEHQVARVSLSFDYRIRSAQAIHSLAMFEIEPVITVDLVLVSCPWVGSLADQVFLSDEVPAYGVRPRPVSTCYLRDLPQLLEFGRILRVRRQVLVAVDEHIDETLARKREKYN